MYSHADNLWAMIRVPQQDSVRHAELPRNEALHLDDDHELMRRIATGDVAAYRAMNDRYLGRIVSFAARLLGGGADADDVAQETFLRLWTEASRFAPRANARPSTWLYRIAHNLCIDRLRKRRPNDSAALERVVSEDRASTDLVRKETAERVNEALARLPERQRTAIALVHYEGMGNIEAASVLEIHVEALESLLSRGRRALRAELLELRNPEGDGV